MTPRLKEQFYGPVWEKLQAEFAVKNRMALPRLEKMILSVGLGHQLEGTKVNAKAREQALQDLALITGQKAVMVKAKKSVSNFKVRKGYETGAMVTVRGDRMWELLDRLITLAIPRIKDFRGLNPKSFDGRGSYSFGLQEQGVFPEVDMANAQHIHGMHVTLTFRNATDEMSRTALRELGMPFTKEDEAQRSAA
ncbi:MAG: 50S ribosomal protein L5 [Phycisphaeraceae bacterium]